jgi:ABC-type transport system involved in multi-copper enzyme maturation permease subunit
MYMLLSVAYTVAYIAALLLGAVLIFSRRDFK